MSAWLTVWDLLPVLLLGAVTTAEITAGAFVLATLIGLTLPLRSDCAGARCGSRSRSMSTYSARFRC